MELERKQEWKIKGIQLGYVLGLSLLIAAIVYFFASNWPGFNKAIKIVLSVGLIGMFYGVSYLLRLFGRRHPFLSRLFLFFGCLSFGVGVALLGQIYNSHADSYMLFVVWSIPAFLFSIASKYQPFYVLTYGLIHLAVYFFLYPSTDVFFVPQAILQWVSLSIAFLNGFLYFVTDRNVLKSKPLQLLSFLSLHVIMLGLTVDEFLNSFNIFVSFLYVGVLAFFYFYHLKNQRHKGYLVLLGLALIAFIIIKFVEFIIYTETENIFLFTFLMPFILIGIVMLGLQKWQLQQKVGEHTFLKKMIVGVTTAIASIIAAISIWGISFLIIRDFSFSFFVFFSIAIILLAKIEQNWDSIITYTLIMTAFLIGIPASIASSNFLVAILFIAVLIYVFWTFTNKMIRYIAYLSIFLVFTGSLIEMNYSEEPVVIFVLLINLVVYFITTVANSLQQVLKTNSLFYGLLSFFILTFSFEDHPALYYLINGFYFGATTFLLIWSLRQNFLFYYRVSLLFWFAYIVYKYYDLVWSLLHKSVTFLITGVLILVIVRKFDRLEERLLPSFGRLKIISIFAIIVVQFAILGIQIGKSESLLANGDLIKLELAPIDPRSMLQGDYLTVRYAISALQIKDEGWNEQVKIGLKENEKGVYEYSGDYVIGKDIPTNKQYQAEVWINGTYKGNDNIEYGIENYFVPEGTGLGLQEKMNYAYVKVAKNGDAMLVDLSED